MKVSKIRVVLTIFFISFIFIRLSADNRIMVFLKNAPEEAIAGAIADAQQQNVLTKLDQMDAQIPSFNSIKNLKNAIKAHLIQKLSGFISLYGGYMNYSDSNGLISFPLRHATPTKLYIALTPEIHLEKVRGETVSHEEFVPEFIVNDQNPTKLYSFERKLDEKKPAAPGAPATAPAPATPPAGGEAKPEEKKMAYWEVKEIPIPENKKINPLTIVILTKPKNIYIPVGKFLTIESTHLILPDFYVLGNVDNENIAFKTLEYSRHFERITTEEKKASDTNVQKMILNL
jgi:hypothetical protein